jgi:hypothetical protein
VPARRFSFGSPISRYTDPVARITARAWWVLPRPVTTVFTVPVRSTLMTSSVTSSAPKRSACARIDSIRSGPMMPSRKPG